MIFILLLRATTKVALNYYNAFLGFRDMQLSAGFMLTFRQENLLKSHIPGER